MRSQSAASSALAADPLAVAARIVSITSAQNPSVKQTLRLRQRRGRERLEKILIDGQREVWCAHLARVPLETLFVEQQRWDSLDAEARQQWTAIPDLQIVTLPEHVLARLSYGGRTDQWVAVACPPRRTLDSLTLRQTPLLAVLEHVEKPGNIGAIVRTADAAGLDALIVSDPATDLYNPNAIRASRGVIFSFPVRAATNDQVMAWLQSRGIQVVVARVDGSVSYDRCDFRIPTAIVLGSEAEGVSTAWLSEQFAAVHLPMRGGADSLNVSVTAGVLFYEAMRQRGR